MRKRFFILGMTAIVAVVLLYGLRSEVYADLAYLNLLPKEEPLTELSFDLPMPEVSAITPGKKIAFAFTVHNLEGTQTEYSYTVSIQSSAGTSMIAQGNLDMENNESRTLVESYTFPKAQSHAVISVTLAPPIEESIHFALPNDPT
jgi:hypothetical protein